MYRSGWFVWEDRGNSLRFKFSLPRARSKQLILKSNRVFEAISIKLILRKQTGTFCKEVLPTAWIIIIQARRNLLFFGKTWKLILVSFLFFAWLLQPKATHCCILTVRSNHDTSSPRSALRAIQDGGRGNRSLKADKKIISLGETFLYFRSSN